MRIRLKTNESIFLPLHIANHCNDGSEFYIGNKKIEKPYKIASLCTGIHLLIVKILYAFKEQLVNKKHSVTLYKLTLDLRYIGGNNESF